MEVELQRAMPLAILRADLARNSVPENRRVCFLELVNTDDPQELKQRISELEALLRASLISLQTALESALEFYSSLPSYSKKPKRGREKKRPGHNLAIRMIENIDSVLRFMQDPAVPFIPRATGCVYKIRNWGQKL